MGFKQRIRQFVGAALVGIFVLTACEMKQPEAKKTNISGADANPGTPEAEWKISLKVVGDFVKDGSFSIRGEKGSFHASSFALRPFNMVVGGTWTPRGINRRSVCVVSVTYEGALNEKFGQDGFGATCVDVDNKDLAGPILLNPDQSIIMAYHAGTSVGLLKFGPDGVQDKRFAENLKSELLSDISQPVSNSQHTMFLARQKTGRILLGTTKNYGIAIFGFTSEGNLDNSFGNKNGLAVLPVTEGDDLYIADVPEKTPAKPPEPAPAGADPAKPGASEEPPKMVPESFPIPIVRSHLNHFGVDSQDKIFVVGRSEGVAVISGEKKEFKFNTLGQLKENGEPDNIYVSVGGEPKATNSTFANMSGNQDTEWNDVAFLPGDLRVFAGSLVKTNYRVCYVGVSNNEGKFVSSFRGEDVLIPKLDDKGKPKKKADGALETELVHTGTVPLSRFEKQSCAAQRVFVDGDRILVLVRTPQLASAAGPKKDALYVDQIKDEQDGGDTNLGPGPEKLPIDLGQNPPIEAALNPVSTSEFNTIFVLTQSGPGGVNSGFNIFRKEIPKHFPK